METIHEQISAIGLEINALVEQRGTLAQALAADPASPTHRAAMRQLNGQIANLEADEQALQQALAAQAEMDHAAKLVREADALAALKDKVEQLRGDYRRKAAGVDKALASLATAMHELRSTASELQTRKNEFTRRTVPTAQLRERGYQYATDFMDGPARGIAAQLAGIVGGPDFRSLIAFNVGPSDEPIVSQLAKG